MRVMPYQNRCNGLITLVEGFMNKNARAEGGQRGRGRLGRRRLLVHFFAVDDVLLYGRGLSDFDPARF